jgi:hypothetical protein
VLRTAEPLTHEPSSFVADIAVEELKIYKSPGIDHIPAEMIQAAGSTQTYQFVWSK